MANYKEYAKRIVDAIKRYGETVYVKTRTSDYDIIEGETYTYKRYKNFKCFFRNTDKNEVPITETSELASNNKTTTNSKNLCAPIYPNTRLIVFLVFFGFENF